MVEAGLGLGSNLGDREKHLNYAVRRLERHPQIKLIKSSSTFVTAPWGVVEQPEFLNSVVLIRTTLSPESLLTFLQLLENQRRRQRRQRWGARTLDLDILWYSNIRMRTKRLTLPHLEMLHRDFVLRPLTEISPKIRFQSETVEHHLRKL